MNPLLFVTYGGGHVEIVQALLPRLESLGIHARVLALTTAAPRLQRAGYAPSTCSDYLPAPGYEQALALGAQLSEGLWQQDSGIAWDDSCSYLGVSMLDLIAEHGPEAAWELYRNQGRQAFCPTRFLCHVLGQVRPALVVTTCHVRMERAAVLAARQLGCRSLLIEDLFGYSMLGEGALRGAPQLPPCSERPDAVIVLNLQVKEHLVRAGFPAGAVHPLGQPVFSDWVARLAAAEPCDALLDWRCQGKPVLTYAAPARRDVLTRHLQVMLRIALRQPAWGVVVKLHPSVGMASIQAELGPVPDNLRLLPGDLDSLPVVKASDLVIVFRSTVGLLALFAGLPLLVFDDSGEPEVMPYVSSGAAVGAGTLAELEQAIARQLAAAPVGGAPVRHPLFENPPDAPERIAAWLQTQVQA